MRTLLIALIDLYQRRWAERYAGACRFEPSCSEFARGAITTYGACLGALLTMARLLRCGPRCADGADPVPSPSDLMRSFRGGLVTTSKHGGGDRGAGIGACR
jgi:putative membrane protein insertion efficiency factor